VMVQSVAEIFLMIYLAIMSKSTSAINTQSCPLYMYNTCACNVSFGNNDRLISYNATARQKILNECKNLKRN